MLLFRFRFTRSFALAARRREEGTPWGKVSVSLSSLLCVDGEEGTDDRAKGNHAMVGTRIFPLVAYHLLKIVVEWEEAEVVYAVGALSNLRLGRQELGKLDERGAGLALFKVVVVWILVRLVSGSMFFVVRVFIQDH